jgi:hypothetical protein
VALSQKHRANLFTSLAPVVGEEEAEALLSQFPSRDLDEPVTKEFVRAEIAEVRTEIAGLRAEMNDRFRLHTMWIAGTNVVAVTVATVLASIIR